LVIGDEAIKAREKFRVVMDLGEEWTDLTGYPMVFGISASLYDAKDCDDLLMKSIDWGLKNFEEIVQSAVKRFKLSEDFLRTYFKALIYKVDTKVEKGLKVFEELCRDHDLL
jgi:chorismate dehydratase